MSLRFVYNFLKPRTSTCLLFRRNYEEKNLVVFDNFSQLTEKNKKTYIDMIKMFEGNDIRRRNHCEFIYSALKYMKEFGVHKDLEVYKALLEVLPKGRFVPKNLLQAEFFHFPKQQQVALELLEQMEDNGVMPDSEMQSILINTFGRRGYPVRKFWRMMYWMPKFKNLSPWPLPEELPLDTLELAMLAITRITSVDLNMEVTVFKTENVKDSVDDTWIVSAQCPIQKKLLEKEALERRKEMEERLQKEMADSKKTDGDIKTTDYAVAREALKVHGPYRVYLRDQTVQYFILSGKAVNRHPPNENHDDISNLNIPTAFGQLTVPELRSDIHEQDDGTVLAVCATGTSSRDSLLSWIRLLEVNGNPDLADLPIVFSFTAPSSELAVQVKDPVMAA